jgi:hypothetical protein
LESWGFSYDWLKSIGLFVGIGFVVFWKRRKKGNELESPPFCVRRVNAIAAFTRKICERGSLRSVKSQSLGHYEKEKVGRRRK